MTRTKHRATRHGGVDDIRVLPGRDSFDWTTRAYERRPGTDRRPSHHASPVKTASRRSTQGSGSAKPIRSDQSHLLARTADEVHNAVGRGRRGPIESRSGVVLTA